MPIRTIRYSSFETPMRRRSFPMLQSRLALKQRRLSPRERERVKRRLSSPPDGINLPHFFFEGGADFSRKIEELQSCRGAWACWGSRVRQAHFGLGGHRMRTWRQPIRYDLLHETLQGSGGALQVGHRFRIIDSKIRNAELMVNWLAVTDSDSYPRQKI
jgi:hypothetical protein